MTAGAATQLPHAALDEILRAAGIGRTAADEIELTGADPVLPVRYRVGTAGGAALAACGLAAAAGR
ncbi:MAG: hypothetical protein EPO20_30745 [Betaproteobacteria bacterium]|nr:MAG: hypothetical protein EPO20_30745 [Betaproteobacteria bacterium]